MRSKFDAQLRELGEKLTLMGAMCEEAIANSAKALLSGDSELAKKLAPLDLEIDRYERDIEALCLRLLLQQQPVARDLRQISAALKMITDLERIGDQAGDIAEIIPHLGGKTGSECAAMRPMAEAAIGMVNSKTTAVRVIPAIGRKAGEVLDFGGLLGYGPIMPVNSHDPSVFINRGGRLPAPMQSLKN